MPPPGTSSAGTVFVFRPEIQGLRALAVVAVILHHLTGWPRGGFVGVDIFFVISGFLITGLLLKERRTTGRISWSAFYRRRTRRLLPAALLVLVATVVASFLLLNAGRGKQTLVDAVWSLFFSANWRFAWSETDYFQAGGAQSPFEHFWSLAVEEQFYLVWPWLIVAGYAVVSRHVPHASRIGHRLVGVVLVLIAVASFVHACVLTASNPTWAYFSTLSRAWELGVGALLAIIASTLSSVPAAWRSALAWFGLAGILVSFLVVREDAPLLGTWGTLPVLSAALVIAAGTGARPRALEPLTHPVAVWIGELSYSLYLWHFPVIVLMAAVLDPTSLGYYAWSSVVILAISVAAFYGVEDPVRKSSWLTGHGTKPGARRVPATASSRRRLVGVGAMTGACLMLFGVAATGQQPSSSASGPVPHTGPAAGSERPTLDSPAAAERAAEVEAALAAVEWPDLDPAVGELRSAAAAPPCALVYNSPQLADAVEVKRRCGHGDPAAKRTVLVIGDSLANSYLPAIVAAVAPEGWNVVGVSRSGCPAIAIDVVYLASRQPYSRCTEHQGLISQWIPELAPDLIVATGSPFIVDRLASGATGAGALRQWRKGAEASWAAWADTAPVVVLQAPPYGKNLQSCATRFSKPSDCVSTPAQAYVNFRKMEKKAVKAVADVRYVGTQDWFCSAEPRCPAFVGTIPTFVDGGHLTIAGARQLQPLVREALRKSMGD